MLDVLLILNPQRKLCMKDIVPILQIRKLKLDRVRLSAQSNVATKWLNTGYSFNWSDSKIFVSFFHYIYCIASQESIWLLTPHPIAILYINRNCLYCVSDATSFLDHIKFRDDTWPISLTVNHPFLLETVRSRISQSPQSPDFLPVSLGYSVSFAIFFISPNINIGLFQGTDFFPSPSFLLVISSSLLTSNTYMLATLKFTIQTFILKFIIVYSNNLHDIST